MIITEFLMIHPLGTVDNSTELDQSGGLTDRQRTTN